MRILLVAGILAVSGVSSTSVDRSAFYKKYGARTHEHADDHDDHHDHHDHHVHKSHGHHSYRKTYATELDAETPLKWLEDLSQ